MDIQKDFCKEAPLLRIMYYNVYGYGRLNSIPDRLEQQVGMIADAAPCILCTQEFDRKHRNRASALLYQNGYREVPLKGTDEYLYAGDINCEAVFYRPDRLTLKAWGGELFPSAVTVGGIEVLGNNDSTKSVTWGVFEDNETGKHFLTVNTHFMWNAPELTLEQAQAVRADNARRILLLIDRVRASDSAYADIPIVFGGDLNCTADSEACRLLGTVLTPAQEVAEAFQKCGYYGCYASYDAETGKYQYQMPTVSDNGIDHVFVHGLTVRRYLPITEHRALITSDHLPWILEACL